MLRYACAFFIASVIGACGTIIGEATVLPPAPIGSTDAAPPDANAGADAAEPDASDVDADATTSCTSFFEDFPGLWSPTTHGWTVSVPTAVQIGPDPNAPSAPAVLKLTGNSSIELVEPNLVRVVAPGCDFHLSAKVLIAGLEESRAILVRVVADGATVEVVTGDGVLEAAIDNNTVQLSTSGTEQVWHSIAIDVLRTGVVTVKVDSKTLISGPQLQKGVTVQRFSIGAVQLQPGNGDAAGNLLEIDLDDITVN